ncbi:translocon-associated protein subunit delta isoform X3 [Mus pahari]|uniref:translocon-associated protein subunit delta isoform X3 n=1 Tax=Mus pahari TaxID=10093 RepID=UPI001114D1B8|nr:translocon-associated protein subunit delta isoform X3 [Mus pahari]
MAAMASFGALALLLLSGLSCCSAEACLEPQITPSYYTTSDAVISTETVFIVEISLTCKNRVQNMALYADVSGKQFPVTRGQDVGRYQVSWSLEHKSAHAGTYEVRFFDEESYSLLRKHLPYRLKEIMRTFLSFHPCSQSVWTIGVPGMGLGSLQRCWLQ